MRCVTQSSGDAGGVLSDGVIRPGPGGGVTIEVSSVVEVESATSGAGVRLCNELFGWCW